jgi:hypothetical protein
MKPLIALRSAAFVMAATAIVDPSFETARPEPAAVEVLRASGSSNPDSPDIARLRERLAGELDAAVVFDSSRKPAAVVMIGSHVDIDAIPSGVPVSIVGRESSSPNVSVNGIKAPGVMRSGWSTDVRVVVSARGMAGKTTTVALEEGGLEIASARHAWTRVDETVVLPLTYIPSAAGSRELRAVARAEDGEQTTDNQVVSTVVVQDRRLRILVHEPRPSWTAVFVRRALEEDTDFDVTALARVSKGLEVRAGKPPASITPEALAGFDAVVVGAPEELHAQEVSTLDAFARRRGGAVAYLAERRPSGAYADRLRLSRHSELLLPNSIRLAPIAGPPLRGSEFVVAGQPSTGLDSLATIDHGGTARPVIVAWPAGAGQIIFSGALDAWRYRGGEDGFARFWRGVIGAAAAKAPARIAVTLERGAVAPGETAVVRARVRATEFDETAPVVSLPSIRARVVGDGFDEVIRMWPSLEFGEFEGRFVAPMAGRYDVRVSLDGESSADAILVVNDEARHRWASSDAARTVAARTGGVAVDESNLRPLVDHLSHLARATVPVTIHPARTPWWTLGFVTLVAAEWLIRRKRGLR